MANYSRGEDPPQHRLPLIGIPNQRGDNPLEDSRLINGYAEQGLDGKWHVFKRPGISLHFDSAPSNGVGLGRGMFIDSAGHLIVAFRQRVAATPANQEIRAWRDGTTIGALYEYVFAAPTNNDGFLEGCIVTTGADTRKLLVNNGKICRLIDTAGAIAEVAYEGGGFSLSCTTTIGLFTVATADTSSLREHYGVSGTGVPADTAIASIDSATQFTMTNAATASGTNSLTFSIEGPPQSLLFPTAKPTLQGIPGAVNLNRTAYMAAPDGRIRGSDIDEPQSWDPLNLIQAYASTEGGSAIARQLSTIILFKETSAEFFRDAGTSPAPLARVEGLFLNTGCQDPHSVRAAGDTLLWSARFEKDQRAVWSSTRLQAKEVSIPAVRRMMATAATGANETASQYGMTFAVGGHTFYLIKLPTGPAPVYDITAGTWSYWTALGEDHWPFVASATGTDGTVYLQHESNGKVYKFDSTVFTDLGELINMDIVPPAYDAGTRKGKYLAKMTVNADLQAGSELQLRVSDDDQKTWSNWRLFDLSHPRPWIDRCGSFTRRHFHFRHSAPTPCRVFDVEFDLAIGSI